MAGTPITRLRRAAALALASAALAAAPAAAAAPSAGAPGVGDPFFPTAGNSGYDVGHYELRLGYRHGKRRLSARARIRAIADHDLSRFSLDYRGPRIRRVAVDGRSAAYERSAHKLVITPRTPIAAGADFRVLVSYRGRAHPIKDPDGAREGWFNTRDGSFVAAEPRGAPTWFPVNDHPTDKATYSFRIRVPRGVEAVANGRFKGRARRGGMREWRWSVDEPMASYLATVATGQFRLRRSKVSGIRSIVAVQPRLWKRSKRTLRKSDRIISLFEDLFGPYPFGQLGAIVVDADTGYALETQTRPIYDGPPGAPLIAHELAHQWFGNSVSLERWPEIWLNEGFATWAQWRWAEQAGGPTTATKFARLSATPAADDGFWNPPPAAVPGPAKLFAGSVYVRGAMALEALRQRIGEQAFLTTLRAWVSEHAYGNATIAEFIALAEATSGEDLGTLFDAWLYRHGKP